MDPPRRHGPSAGIDRALALAARHINASTPRVIPEQDLLAALRTGEIAAGYEHHVHAFFDETDTATIADLVISGAVSYAQLASLADRLLPDHHPTRSWLDERRPF